MLVIDPRGHQARLIVFGVLGALLPELLDWD